MLEYTETTCDVRGHGEPSQPSHTQHAEPACGCWKCVCERNDTNRIISRLVALAPRHTDARAHSHSHSHTHTHTGSVPKPSELTSRVIIAN